VVSKENSSDHRVRGVSLRPINASLDFLPVTNHPRALDLKSNQGWLPFGATSEHALHMCSESV
jgi:hypothetical protein